MKEKTLYIVRAFWDKEAKVWVASSENFIGIATEASTFEKLIEKLNIMVPEILEANGYIASNHHNIPYQLISDCIAANTNCH